MLHPRGECDANVAGRNSRGGVEHPDTDLADGKKSRAEDSAQIANPSMREIVRRRLFDARLF
jgi:hypothetical protein